MIQIGPHGLAVVRCQPGAPATRMGAQELTQIEQAALAGEDLHRAGRAA